MATNKNLKREIVKQMVTLSTSGFGLVAALAWNNFIQELVKQLLPKGSGLVYLLIYAVIITVLAVVVTVQLSKVLDRLDGSD